MDATRKRRFKTHIYEVLATVGKALGNGHRLELLDVLCQAERSVEELAFETGMSLANTSQHLQVLRRVGLVTARRQGTRSLYRLAGDPGHELWVALRTFGEAEVPAVEHVVRTYLGHRDELEKIDVDELRRRLQDDSVTLLDVRPAAEYASGHIPGARSLPIDELEARLAELPEDQEIIAYCRGRYCVYADEAVAVLRQQGFRARRFELGVRDFNRVQ